MTGGYVFLNALIFWATRVSFGGLTGAVLYVGYSALIAFIVFILTGMFLFPCLADGLLLLTSLQAPLVSSPVGHSSTASMARSRWTKGFAIGVTFSLAFLVTREDIPCSCVCFCALLFFPKKESFSMLGEVSWQIDSCLIWRNVYTR